MFIIATKTTYSIHMSKNAKLFLNPKVWILCKVIVIILCHPIQSISQHNCSLHIGHDAAPNTTADYAQLRSFFHNAANCSPYAKYLTIGDTDSGKPLQVFLLDKSEQFQPLQDDDKRVFVLINNGIHPGEPCGVDASMQLVRDMLERDSLVDLLDHVMIGIVPMYNIGGCLNRNSHSRANQNGPEAYGFRGNAQNLDLNRDFVKTDSRNAKALTRFMATWLPDLFIDTHTSNGADYQYTMTLIANMRDRLTPPMEQFVHEKLLPAVYADMDARGWEMSPYVDFRGAVDRGIYAFDDLPRYSMGYGVLHHIPSFTSEAHMLKPYADRVKATRAYLESMLSFAASNKAKLQRAIDESVEYYAQEQIAPLKWKVNPDIQSTLSFKGYMATTRTSLVTGMDRLYYDRDSMYEKEIPYFESYDEVASVEVPAMYVVRQANDAVAERLRQNGVEMIRCRRDSQVMSQSYYITSYETTKRPYEGHYLHYNTEVDQREIVYTIHAGDYMIPTNQRARRFLVETLEPQAPDSYFNWNFFDGILMQKEYFSSYVFEDTAARLLKSDASLRRSFEERRQVDTTFAQSSYAQLKFIYENSEHYEKTHNLYPVGRIF